MEKVWNFAHDMMWDDLPAVVQQQARRCLLDTLGSGIGGRGTATGRIIHDFAAAVFGGGQAALWQDGRRVSAPGAALANGMTIDALDIHDGHKLTKGHPGAGIVPAVLVGLSLGKSVVSGKELLCSLVAGYEISLRAGIALHATASDYHSTGAWNALGCAAVTGRRLGLTGEQTRHALGIAEYHGPRSQIMRVVDYPTMIKDGAGWGAMAGVSAGLLAAQGFSGAPALTVERGDARGYWEDLGSTWRILEVYFKPYGVCRWAQPAIAAALRLQAEHALRAEDIRAVKVHTFEAATHLTCRAPANTDEAQYSLPFPVAAALVNGQVGPVELDGSGLKDAEVLRIAGIVEVVNAPELTALFPAQRFARVEITTGTGQVFRSENMTARWEYSEPPSDAELIEKYRWLAGGCLPDETAARIERLAWNCADLADAAELEQALAAV